MTENRARTRPTKDMWPNNAGRGQFVSDKHPDFGTHSILPPSRLALEKMGRAAGGKRYRLAVQSAIRAKSDGKRPFAALYRLWPGRRDARVPERERPARQATSGAVSPDEVVRLHFERHTGVSLWPTDGGG